MALAQLLAYLIGLLLAEAGLALWPLALAAVALRRADLALWFLLGQLQGNEPLWVLDTRAWELTLGASLRASALAKLEAGLPGHLGSLLGGMVLGRTAAGFSLEAWPHWRDAGMAHLLVASGAQVTLFVLPIATLLQRDSLGHRGRQLLVTLMLLQIGLVLLLTGLEPSILRAATLGGWGLIALLLGRPVQAVEGLYRVALCWLVLDPSLAHSASFHLSYAATWAMLLTWQQVERPLHAFADRGALQRWVARLAAPSLLTVAAQVAVLPVLWAWFGRLQLAGFGANLLAVPLSELILFLASLKIALASLGLETLARWCNPALRWGLDALDGLATWFGQGGSLHLEPLPALLVGAVVALLGSLGALVGWLRNRKLIPTEDTELDWRVTRTE